MNEQLRVVMQWTTLGHWCSKQLKAVDVINGTNCGVSLNEIAIHNSNSNH